MSMLKDCDLSKGTQRRFYGKYRGHVVNNLDPERRARICAVVTDVSHSSPSTWALPSLPWCGPQMGMVCVPPIGAAVWIEFEQGDLDYPIWSGCFWESQRDVPSAANSVLPSTGITFQTPLLQNVLQLSDSGIKLVTKVGTVEIRQDQISITHGSAEIVLQGAIVKINGDALQIT